MSAGRTGDSEGGRRSAFQGEAETAAKLQGAVSARGGGPNQVARFPFSRAVW